MTVWQDTDAPRGRAVLVHGSTTWGASAFARQRPLAATHRLELVDRRGYGASPDVAHSDALLDAADLVDVLAADVMGNGPAHLVGHSFGTVVALLAAGRVPGAVRSLTLIEPSCYRAVADDPVVGDALRRNRESMAGPLPDLSPAEFLRLSTESLGLPPLESTPERLRAAATAMAERPCWDVDVPLGPVADAPWPTLVVSGTWTSAPAASAYRAVAAEPLTACGRATAERIGAELLRVGDAAHEPHWEQAATVNAALARLWPGHDHRLRYTRLTHGSLGPQTLIMSARRVRPGGGTLPSWRRPPSPGTASTTPVTSAASRPPTVA